MDKKKRILIVCLVLAVAAGIGTFVYISSYHFVGGNAYLKSAQELDLTDRDLSIKHYEALREKMPDCDITWLVPFQNQRYEEDTTSLTVTSLTDADVKTLDYLPLLETVDARGCTDYDQLLILQERRPDCRVLYTVLIGSAAYDQDASSVTVSAMTDEEIALLPYLPKLKQVNVVDCVDYGFVTALQAQYPQLKVTSTVEISGEQYPADSAELILEDPDLDQLMEKLPCFTQLKSLSILEPTGGADKLLALVDAYPGVQITWQKTVWGVTLFQDAVEADLSSGTPDSVEQVEEALTYFPDVEHLFLGDCGLDNEALAEFRARVREDYKVVWAVWLGEKQILRTDVDNFIPGKQGQWFFTNDEVQNLRYCEEMMCLDLGHLLVEDISFVEYMPNLQYLILADNSKLTDISLLSGCTELIYLEIFETPVSDYTPLLALTKLEDLNAASTRGDVTFFAQMPWLKNLWINKSGVNEENKEYLEEVLPDTYINFYGGDCTGYGWRKLDNYYKMRDILDMYYMS